MKDLTFTAIAEKAGMTTSQLARRFNIPLRTAQQWVSGDRTPPQYILQMMDALIDIDKQKEGRE